MSLFDGLPRDVYGNLPTDIHGNIPSTIHSIPPSDVWGNIDPVSTFLDFFS